MLCQTLQGNGETQADVCKCMKALVISKHCKMCICVWKMQDKGTLDGRKLLGRRGTLLFVSVIGLCLVLLCLCNFDTQKDVHMCMENARQGNTGRKEIALAMWNPPHGLCDWTLSCFTLSL